MAMMISKFWKALDELSDSGSSRHGWDLRLGDEWKAVAPFLPTTGKLAASLACPSPGAAGCPRRVVQHGDGTASAVCGDSPKSCKTLDVSFDAIRIHALDIRKFAAALVAAFDLWPLPQQKVPSLIVRLGSRERAAGLGVPVFLCIPGSTPSHGPKDLDEILETPTPSVLLCPSTGSLPDAMSEPLRRWGATVLPLDISVIARGPGKFALTPQGNVIMQNLLEQLYDIATQAKGPQRVWDLPPDTRWEDMTIRFTAVAWINVSVGGVTRAFEPDAFGLRNTKTQETAFKEAWKFFLALGIQNGRYPLHCDSPKDTQLLQKNKQALSKALKKAFGLDGDPIQVVKGEYVTRFVLSADELRQGRQGQISTKFR